jgi:hypothetical protein
VTGYQPRHARPEGLPEVMRGLADLIVIVPSKSDDGE